MLRFSCIAVTKTEVEAMGVCAVFSKHKPAQPFRTVGQCGVFLLEKVRGYK